MRKSGVNYSSFLLVFIYGVLTKLFQEAGLLQVTVYCTFIPKTYQQE